MQRQKTIAKWLAIILLLTAIVAAYLALNAVLGKNNGAPSPDIAGAGDGGGTTDVISPPPVKEPVYSSFPRQGETVDGLTVSHVGGDCAEAFLDSVYYEGKRLIIFSSESEQYDVRSKGIHMAIFDGHSLCAVNKIAEADEEYVRCGLVQNGLLIISKTASITILRLYDGNCRLIAENSCDAYSSYMLFQSGAAVTLFAASADKLVAMTITKALDVVRKNYLHSIENAELLYAISLSETMLIVQNQSGIKLISYNANEGFSLKSEILNCRFVQLLPSVSGADRNFVIAAENDEGILLTNIDGATAKSDYSFLIEGANSVACVTRGNNIFAIAGKTAYKFCSHLELQDEYEITFANGNYDMPFGITGEDIIYAAVNGENELFFVQNAAKFALVRFDGETVRTVFSAAGTEATLVREPLGNGERGISMLFEGTAANDFAYMCFGETDLFYTTLSSELTNALK